MRFIATGLTTTTLNVDTANVLEVGLVLCDTKVGVLDKGFFALKHEFVNIRPSDCNRIATVIKRNALSPVYSTSGFRESVLDLITKVGWPPVGVPVTLAVRGVFQPIASVLLSFLTLAHTHIDPVPLYATWDGDCFPTWKDLMGESKNALDEAEKISDMVLRSY